jgi:hypothetical protein
MGFTLQFPVGRGVKNHPEDTLKVQDALNRIPPHQGGAQPQLDPDGKAGPKTNEAIQKFQLKHFGWKGADGRVDVDGPTHRKLNELLDTNPLPGPPPVEPEPTSQSFSMRLNSKADGEYSFNRWRLLITDEANIRSQEFWVRTFDVPLPGVSFTRHWGSAFYFHIREPVALSGFGGAGVEFRSVLTKRGSAGIDIVDGNLTIDRGENWYNEMTMRRHGEAEATTYWNTPFQVLDCWLESTKPPNIGRPGTFTHRFRGHLIPSPELVTMPVLAARPMTRAERDALRRDMGKRSS